MIGKLWRYVTLKSKHRPLARQKIMGKYSYEDVQIDERLMMEGNLSRDPYKARELLQGHRTAWDLVRLIKPRPSRRVERFINWLRHMEGSQTRPPY